MTDLVPPAVLIGPERIGQTLDQTIYKSTKPRSETCWVILYMAATLLCCHKPISLVEQPLEQPVAVVARHRLLERVHVHLVRRRRRGPAPRHRPLLA